MIRLTAILLILVAGASQAAGPRIPPTGWSPDGSRIVVAARLTDGLGVYILDTEGRKHDFIAFAHEIVALKWRDSDAPMCLLARHSDGKCYIWLANPTGIIERVSSRPVYMGDVPGANHFDCSPDGRYVVFASGSGKDVDLWRVDTETAQERQLTKSGGRDSGPAWSPDGKWIAFASERGGTAGIWVVASGGGLARKIFDGPDSEQHPSWSPKSDSLVYLAKGKSEGIYISPLSGGKRKPVAIGGRGYAAPVWSSTGKWIAFVYGKDPSNLFCTPTDKAKGWGPYYQATFDRTKETRTDLRAPVWSPTSDQLTFATVEFGKMTVRLTNMSPKYGTMRSSDVFTIQGTATSGKTKNPGDR